MALCVNRGRNETPVSATAPAAAAVKLQDGLVAGRAGIATQQNSTAHACAAADTKLPGGVSVAGVRQSNV